MQRKATYTLNFLLEKWIRKYGRTFTYIVKFGMNPHRGTRNGDDDPDKSGRKKEVKCLNNIITVVADPSYTHTHTHMQFQLRIFTILIILI